MLVIPRAVAKARQEQTIPLPPDITTMLRDHIASRPLSERFQAAPLLSIPSDLGSWFRWDLDRPGIEHEADSQRLTLSSFRKSFGTFLARAGIEPLKLRALMRHSTLQMTLKYYVRLGSNDVAGAVDILPGSRRFSIRRPQEPAAPTAEM